LCATGEGKGGGLPAEKGGNLFYSSWREFARGKNVGGGGGGAELCGGGGKKSLDFLVVKVKNNTPLWLRRLGEV